MENANDGFRAFAITLFIAMVLVLAIVTFAILAKQAETNNNKRVQKLYYVFCIVEFIGLLGALVLAFM